MGFETISVDEKIKIKLARMKKQRSWNKFFQEDVIERKQG